MVSCSSLLRSTSSSSCGYSMPSWPCLCFSLFTLSMVVGHHSVSRLQTIWIPLLQSTISRCSAGLPQALSPVTLLFFFSRRQLVILLLCNKDITPPPQLSGLKVLACLLSLILQLGFLLQFNLSCLPELTQPRAYARHFSLFHPPSMITPINPGKLEWELMGHPNCSVADYARTSLCHGFRLGFNLTAVSFRSASLNMSSAFITRA